MPAARIDQNASSITIKKHHINNVPPNPNLVPQPEQPRHSASHAACKNTHQGAPARRATRGVTAERGTGAPNRDTSPRPSFCAPLLSQCRGMTRARGTHQRCNFNLLQLEYDNCSTRKSNFCMSHPLELKPGQLHLPGGRTVHILSRTALAGSLHPSFWVRPPRPRCSAQDPTQPALEILSSSKLSPASANGPRPPHLHPRHNLHPITRRKTQGAIVDRRGDSKCQIIRSGPKR